MGLQVFAQHNRETEAETSVAGIDSFNCLKLINGIIGKRIVEDSCFYHTFALKCMWLGIRGQLPVCLLPGITLEKDGIMKKGCHFGGKRFYTVHGGTGRREESES